MPPSSPQPVPTVLRFCGSCAATLVCWAVWLVLGASLATLIYVAVAKELPVPDFVLRRAEAELAKANLAIKFGRARLDPTGIILLEDVQLRSRQFADPLLTCRLIYVRRDIWSVLAGRPIPDEIRLEGAALQLPAMLSPSGTVEPLVRDLALVLRHEDNRWLVDQFTGRIGPLSITAQGELTVPTRPAGAPPLSPDAIAAQFLQLSRRLALELHQLDAFEEPSLAVRLESPAGVGNLAHLLLTAKVASQPWAQPLTLGPFAATAIVRLDGLDERPVRLYAAARRASFRGECAVENVRAILSARFLPGSFSARPVEAFLAAGTVTTEGESALGPVLRADLAGWPDEVRTTVAAQIDGEFLAAEVEARLQEQSARILLAEGRAAAGLINRVLTVHTPRAAPYFVFADPVAFHGEARFGPGWRFVSAAGRVDAGRLDSHGVKITSARGRIDINGTDFLARDARVTMAGNVARGSYWMDFSTTDYRMLLSGRLRPPDISGWFRGDWWTKFWNEHFAFPGALPEAVVDVSGRWKEAARTVYFGRTEARSARVWGGDFEQTHALVFLRPHFTHVIEFNATRAGGAQRLDGWIKRWGNPATRETQRMEFDLSGSVDPAVYAEMLEGRMDSLLATMQFNSPPRVHAAGTIEGKAPHATPNYSFTGQAEGGLHYYGFPLETVQVAGGVTGQDVRLDDIQFTTAGGKGTGKAAVSGPPDNRRLGFDVYLNGADLARTIRAVEEYQLNRTGQNKVASAAASKFMQRASGGRLDLAVSALGQPGDIASFTGTGNAALTGANLGEIQLFGLLSQVLSTLSLNFSSLKLDEVRTSFKMEAGRLNFPDLRISGPSAVIDARGNYEFATNSLDFAAKFKPFEEKHTLLTEALGIIVNPITSILELKLTGPLSNPDWSIVVGPSGSHPENPAAAPKNPSAPDPQAEPGKSNPPKG
ncbi:MAG TPA: AsmA-like C-terminal region-containing protein [Lacunisphaera sp.]|nr:AsmA-like C-terminal region-containing protein [Lacunisphaera sp.]